MTVQSEVVGPPVAPETQYVLPVRRRLLVIPVPSGYRCKGKNGATYRCCHKRCSAAC